jgi:hypothetical protein
VLHVQQVLATMTKLCCLFLYLNQNCQWPVFPMLQSYWSTITRLKLVLLHTKQRQTITTMLYYKEKNFIALPNKFKVVILLVLFKKWKSLLMEFCLHGQLGYRCQLTLLMFTLCSKLEPNF